MNPLAAALQQAMQGARRFAACTHAQHISSATYCTVSYSDYSKLLTWWKVTGPVVFTCLSIPCLWFDHLSDILAPLMVSITVDTTPTCNTPPCLLVTPLPRDAAMAQGGFPAGGAAPAPFPFAPAPSAAAAGAATGARTLASSAPEPPPAWLKPLLTWWDVPAASPGGGDGGAAPPTSGGAGAGESAAVPGAEAQAALAVLGKALGEAVGLAGMPSQPAGALLLKCAAA